MKTEDRAALIHYDPSNNMVLKVVKDAQGEHLEAKKQGMFGRIWMKIRGDSSPYSTQKIFEYSAKNQDSLGKIDQLSDIYLLDKITDKFDQYKDKLGEKNKIIKQIKTNKLMTFFLKKNPLKQYADDNQKISAITHFDLAIYKDINDRKKILFEDVQDKFKAIDPQNIDDAKVKELFDLAGPGHISYQKDTLLYLLDPNSAPDKDWAKGLTDAVTGLYDYLENNQPFPEDPFTPSATPDTDKGKEKVSDTEEVAETETKTTSSETEKL